MLLLEKLGLGILLGLLAASLLSGSVPGIRAVPGVVAFNVALPLVHRDIPAAAAETVSLLEPKLVLPMHYQTPAAKAQLDPLDRFLKEMGAPSALEERQNKLSVTKSTLPQETKVLVLDYRG